LFDLVETGGDDVDGDGIVDSAADSGAAGDPDGIPDSVDVDVTGGVDSDSDGIDDFADASFVFGDDTDGDGIIDEFDPDADGDGRVDTVVLGASLGASLPDGDFDGTPDFQEAENGALRTGLKGRGGCSIAGPVDAKVDPLLALMCLLALSVLVARLRRQELAQEQTDVTQPSTVQKLFAVVFLLSLCSAASAEGLKLGPYLGAGVGLSWLEPDASEINLEVEDRLDAAFSGVLGLDLTRRLSAEVTYDDLGRAELGSNVQSIWIGAEGLVLMLEWGLLECPITPMCVTFETMIQA